MSGVHSTKHTYISVKEGIKCKRTFILWHVSIRKMSQMSLLFHLYFVVGSGSRYWYDSNAFLFSLVNKPGWAPVRLPQTRKYSSRRQHSIDMTCTYQNSRHPFAIRIVTLAILTAHRAGTPTAVPSPKHSWQEHTCSHQEK